MNIQPINTKADYKTALKQISTLIDIDPALGTVQAVHLKVLGALVLAYEAKHYKLELPAPFE